MDFDAPQLVMIGVAAGAIVIWLCALRFLLNATRPAPTPTESWQDEDLPTDPSETSVRGGSEVAGLPAELAAKAAAHLAQHGAAALGPVKIMEQTDSRVVFEAAPHLQGRFILRGVLGFHALGEDRTQIDYTVAVPRRHGLLVAGWICQVLGLIVLVVGFPALYLWVAPHPNPAVRWQSVQIIHVLHFLWPPFLFAGLYRRVQTHVRHVMDSLVHNLPYLQG